MYKEDEGWNVIVIILSIVLAAFLVFPWIIRYWEWVLL